MTPELALHEAGHAVVMKALGYATTHIVERNTDDIVATCYGRQADADKLSAQERGMIALGGIAAGVVAQAHGVDVKVTFGDSDLKASECLGSYEGAAWLEAFERTRALLDEHWNELEALAAELERGDLYSERLQELGYWWPLPEPTPNPSLRSALSGNRLFNRRG